MRGAYGLIGVAWILIIAAAMYSAHHSFIGSKDTEHIIQVIPSSMATSTLSLSSSAFEMNAVIPERFTCDGEHISPPLSIAGVPEGVKSLTLILHDPDVPKVVKPDGIFDHWVLFNIPPTTSEIAAGASVGMVGTNGAGKSAYTAPCPPAQYEPSEHRYFFKLYALDIELPFEAGASKTDVEKAMQGHVLDEVQLLGRYKRK